MRIGLDARAYGWAGLGRYTRSLLRHLAVPDAAHEFVVFTPRAYAPEVARLPRVRVVPVTDSYYSVQEQTVFLGSLLRERLDLVHFPHFNAPVLYRRPSVVTIHDLTRFLFPAQKHRGLVHQWAYEEVFRTAVMHARRVIAVSQHTESDLLRLFPGAAGRTVVTYEGVEHERYQPTPSLFDAEALRQLGVRQPYLLFVGVWMNHKNLARLLEAFRVIRRQGFPGVLVITGSGRSHDEDVPRHVSRLGLRHAVHFPGVVAEALLPSLYRRAAAFLFPSLYEGFGLPPLEAMACGVPVVASRVASLPEVLGDAAEYVDPLSVADIARGTLRVLQNDARRARLIAAGQRRAQLFQWRACARATLGVYQASGAC